MALYRTGEHPCGYYADRVARDLVLDPRDPAVGDAYPTALTQGFRRSGGHVYRPNCPACQACVPVRLCAREFRPDRSQRRCSRDNADVETRMVQPLRTRENFALYQKYLLARHADGPMADTDEDDFDQFVASAWSPTRFMELRRNGRLLGVAITDLVSDALSAVYTFFDPDERSRGIGTLAILRQIEIVQRTGRDYLYLGYWIDSHPKMHYKAHFRPLQQLGRTGWRNL
ncbi:MAG TPA: arginyltransferase [Xanthomonadaceae bacterium]|jgi:arginyl-tRNA--protein-N-Asp/Glu arginylyltransferase|nr:arginyltransferase [Xanthomonadaceae bacterium]